MLHIMVNWYVLKGRICGKKGINREIRGWGKGIGNKELTKAYRNVEYVAISVASLYTLISVEKTVFITVWRYMGSRC